MATDAAASRAGTPRIRAAGPGDACALARIYNYYVANTVVTFEEQPLTPETMAARVAEVQSVPLPWLVAELSGEIVGYACATRWKMRSAYRHSVETTIYLEHGRAGAGIGMLLYGTLVAQLKEQGHHAIIGGTALPNEASVALHRKLGFQHVGTFREVGFKQNRWVDVAYWQVVS
jgi:phosphinothricin acetyltransferase